ncbi:hypothetical protein B1144_00090 [Enterococcus faecium]|nr:hypothetical protein B1144_00090 [Enterococcus faecium]
MLIKVCIFITDIFSNKVFHHKNHLKTIIRTYVLVVKRYLRGKKGAKIRLPLIYLRLNIVFIICRYC